MYSLQLRLICTVKECDIGLITYNSITSVIWGVEEGFLAIYHHLNNRGSVFVVYVCAL